LHIWLLYIPMIYTHFYYQLSVPRVCGLYMATRFQAFKMRLQLKILPICWDDLWLLPFVVFCWFRLYSPGVGTIGAYDILTNFHSCISLFIMTPTSLTQIIITLIKMYTLANIYYKVTMMLYSCNYVNLAAFIATLKLWPSQKKDSCNGRGSSHIGI